MCPLSKKLNVMYTSILVDKSHKKMDGEDKFFYYLEHIVMMKSSPSIKFDQDRIRMRTITKLTVVVGYQWDRTWWCSDSLDIETLIKKKQKPLSNGTTLEATSK